MRRCFRLQSLDCFMVKKDICMLKSTEHKLYCLHFNMFITCQILHNVCYNEATCREV